MDAKDDGGSAFPWTEHNGDGSYYWDHHGMSLRDYFATKAMQEMINRYHLDTPEYISRAAYDMADAMLKARNA